MFSNMKADRHKKKDGEEKILIHTKCLDISSYSAFKYICMCECAVYIYI